MSRIGNSPISLAEGVEFNVSDTNLVTVKGPKGELTQQVDTCISFEVEDKEIIVKRASEIKDHKAKHGLYRSLVQNMVTGVSQGFKKEQELIGVGYRAKATGQQLDLVLGYSHNVIMQLPDEVKVTTLSEKGKSPVITLESHDKQLLGQVAARIRSLRKPEPYKGKGIRFVGEQIRRKAGKSAAKA